MADIAIQPIWQVLDGNGNPYPAARATFFLSGTSTPLTVYTDIGLTVAHPVPVVADANGVFPPVYLGSAAAKAVITTSTGAAIKTVDPVPKTTASSTGAAQVSFAPTAAIPSTTVQAAIEQVQANLEGSSTAFVKTLLDDTTATAFMTTLGGTAAGQAVFKAADAAAQRATLGATSAGSALFTAADVAAQLAALGGSQSLAASGWAKIPGGLIVQWGTTSVGSGSTVVTFPTTFPTLCASVVASHEGVVDVTAVVAGITTSQVTLRAFNQAGGLIAALVRWVAVGY